AAKPPRQTCQRSATYAAPALPAAARRSAKPRTPHARASLVPRRSLGTNSTDDVSDRAHELRLGHGAEELLLHLTALDQEEVRDGAHAVLLRSARVVVDVHLDDLELPRVLARQVLHDGTDGPAGP